MYFTDMLGEQIGRPTQYFGKLVRITGSANATILAGQLVYWSGKEWDADGWIYKTMEDLSDETGLTRTELLTARKRLTDRKILQEKHRGIPCKLWFKINYDVFNKLADELIINLREEEKTKQKQRSAQKSPYGTHKTNVPKDEQYQQSAGTLQTRKQEPFEQVSANPANYYIDDVHKRQHIYIEREASTPHQNISVLEGEKPNTRSKSLTSQVRVSKHINVADRMIAINASIEVITYLNEQTGSTFSTENSVRYVAGCIKMGLSVDDLKRIVDNTMHFLDDDKQRCWLKPSYLFGRQALELSALPTRKKPHGRMSSQKEEFYLENPTINPSAVLVDEINIPVGTIAWDKAGREIML